MGYYSGSTFLYKKDEKGVWRHKKCNENKVKEYVQFGCRFLMCMGESCQSSSEQVIRGETKRSTIDDE